MKKYMVADVLLAPDGLKRIEWAAREMPVLASIREEFRRRKPLDGVRVGACLHVTTETANLVIALKEGGAEVSLCASNPLSTQDDVAAALVEEYEVSVYAVHGEDRDTYYQAIHRTLDLKPNLTMDDGADLLSTVHKERRDLIATVFGGTEETTTGVVRLRAMEAAGELAYPVISVNDARTKHLFDNRYGTGQSTIDGILRATNILLAGKNFVVLGYGWCGRGIAMRAHGMGARVIVTEVDAVKALEAAMDGFTVMPALEAAKVGDIFVTATGNTSVLTAAHFARMKDGAIVANSGHFNVEIDVAHLDLQAESKRKIRPNLDEYTLKGDRRLYVLGEGRLVNLAAAEGHPAAVMDMSFANQALCAEYIASRHKELEKRVYPVPVDIDDRIALLKLKSMGMAKDELTEAQRQYMSSWEGGT